MALTNNNTAITVSINNILLNLVPYFSSNIMMAILSIFTNGCYFRRYMEVFLVIWLRMLKVWLLAIDEGREIMGDKASLRVWILS